MSDWAILGVLLVMAACGASGFAAGIAAILFLWWSNVRSRGRIVLACGLTGLAAALAIAFLAIVGDDGSYAYDLWQVVSISSAVTFVVVGALGMPAALLVSRRLERPEQTFRVFE